MDPKEKELLEKTFEYAKENNKILRGMRRSLRLHSFLRALYWIIIIVATVWLYYYIQPFIDSLKSGYQEMGEVENLSELIKSSKLLLDQYSGQ